MKDAVASALLTSTKPDGKRFVHYGYTSYSLRPTLKRRAQRTKPGKPGSQGASAPFVTWAWCLSTRRCLCQSHASRF